MLPKEVCQWSFLLKFKPYYFHQNPTVYGIVGQILFKRTLNKLLFFTDYVLFRSYFSSRSALRKLSTRQHFLHKTYENLFQEVRATSMSEAELWYKVSWVRCANFRPFEIVAGRGFLDLSKELIQLGTKRGQVLTRDVIPHPTNVFRNITDIAENLRETFFKPELKSCLNR